VWQMGVLGGKLGARLPWKKPTVLGLGQLQAEGVSAQGIPVRGKHLKDLGRGVVGSVVEHDLRPLPPDGVVRERWVLLRITVLLQARLVPAVGAGDVEGRVAAARAPLFNVRRSSLHTRPPASSAPRRAAWPCHSAVMPLFLGGGRRGRVPHRPSDVRTRGGRNRGDRPQFFAPQRRPAATEGHWLRRHRRLAAQRGRQGKPFLLAPMTGQAAFAGGLLYRR